MIYSDWHIHSEYSYDASNSLTTIAENAKEHGLKWIGITDHLNFNDKKFIGDLTSSAIAVKEAQKKYPFMVLGVELTPRALPEIEYCGITGTRDGYVDPVSDKPYELAMALTKEELKKFGVRYAVTAAHWDVSVPMAKRAEKTLNEIIKEWHRQQMWLASDERTTILAHPWYHGGSVWYEDFSVIPCSMNEELCDALKRNGKHVECNSHFFHTEKASEKFKNQYAEFLRWVFEKGIKITYGSDAHDSYSNKKILVEEYLQKVGFKDGDFYDLTEKDFW